LYLIGRHYDPETGQCLTVDPLVQETGLPYTYTGDDPVNGVDPTGRAAGHLSPTAVCADEHSRNMSSCITTESERIREGPFDAYDICELGSSRPEALALALGFATGGLGDLIDAFDGAAADAGEGELAAGGNSEPTPSGSGPGTPRLGQPPDSSWPVQTGGNCIECAAQIQQEIGGDIETIEPPEGAKSLGPSANNTDGDWQYHTFVVKNGFAFDGFTGPQGIPIAEYLQQFEYNGDLNIVPGGPSK
jgi:hypothetical protein